MEPESGHVETELPSEATAQQLLDLELRVLKLLPGVGSVADFPPGGIAAVNIGKPNENGVRLRLDGHLIKQTFNHSISDKLEAARVLKARMKGAAYVGEAAVLAAEEQALLGAAQPQQYAPEQLTEAELQWLSNWSDEQPNPDQISLEQANAALSNYRASSGGTSTTQVLFEAQVALLHARHLNAHGCPAPAPQHLLVCVNTERPCGDRVPRAARRWCHPHSVRQCVSSLGGSVATCQASCGDHTHGEGSRGGGALGSGDQ
jgi:hypothetical protein